MRIIKTLTLLAAGLVLSTAALANTLTIQGVKIEETEVVGGVTLQLNGAGTRFRGPFKVYVGDLYTTRKVKNLQELLAAPGPKRL